MHQTSAQGQSLTLLLSALKTGKSTMKFQNLKVFFPSYFQKKWTWSPHQVTWLCSLRLQAKKGTWRNLHLLCISQARQAWTTQPYHLPILAAHQFVVLDWLTSRASPGSPTTREVTGTPQPWCSPTMHHPLMFTSQCITWIQPGTERMLLWV